MTIVFVAAHASEHTRRWVAFFADRGHVVHVVTCGDSPSGIVVAGGRYTVHDLGRPRPGKLGYLLARRRARRLIRALRPDVVHAHHATSYGLLGAASGIHPFVVTCHGSDILRSPRNPMLRWIVSRTLRAADLITVPGGHMRAVAERLAGGGARVEVFQYGVPVDELEAVAAATVPTAVNGRALRVVTARPLEPLYNTADVVDAVARLVARGRDIVYDVAGEGDERTRLEHLAAAAGVADRVRFHGRVGEADVHQLLAAADVYVSIAASDGVSIALLEAMALGPVPVVANIASNRDWITNGENGVLVDITSEALAEGIDVALALDRERVRVRNLGLVRARADRTTNLSKCEALLGELVESGH